MHVYTDVYVTPKHVHLTSDEPLPAPPPPPSTGISSSTGVSFNDSDSGSGDGSIDGGDVDDGEWSVHIAYEPIYERFCSL